MTMDNRNGGDFLAVGTRLEEFEIKGKLEAGGYGVTYRAHDHLLDRRVAIKEYLPRDWGMRGPDGVVWPLSATHAKDYEWGLDRFLREARALARLRRHAHILQVHRVFEARGTAYMVMEYVKGRSLAEALRAEGSWTEARVLALLDALTAGLAEVHEAGLVHRDVTPANVMLREDDDSPVLIDFGAVRQAAVGRSGSLQPVLTPGYAPIEQYSEKGVLGPWTDVYALGAVAYEALSGRVPDEATERASEDTLRPVSEVASQEVSARLSSAVMSALALRRQDRPQNLAKWRDLLPPVDGEPERPETGLWRLLARAAALVTVTSAVVGLVGWCGGESESDSAGTVVREPVKENAGRAVLNDGRGPEVGVSGRADVEEAAPETEAGNGANPSPTANETGSAQEAPALKDSAPTVAPKAVEEALGLDHAGWWRIQEGLVALGFDPGAPDGLVGGGMRRAVRAYQQGAGKAVTGYLDAADVTALRDAASEADRVAEQRTAETERQQLAADAAAAAEAERRRLTAAARRRAASWHPGQVVSDDCDGCPEIVVIPAGGFIMGSPASETNRNDDEGPQHRVTVSSFALGVKEVIFDEWDACVRDSGCNGYRPNNRGWGRGSHPVIDVSWEDAQAYVSWLSEETGAEYRLPSESEWEYAARAGTKTPFHTGATIATDQANYGMRFIWGVRRLAPNMFGLYDMHGNVWEWVEDCWHDSYRGAPNDGTAWTVGGDCRRRVLRGGSWIDFAGSLRSANRHRYTADDRNHYYLLLAGFRVARTLD